MTLVRPDLPVLLVATLGLVPAAPATGAAPGADQRYLPADKSGLTSPSPHRAWADGTGACHRSQSLS